MPILYSDDRRSQIYSRLNNFLKCKNFHKVINYKFQKFSLKIPIT